MSSRPPLNLLVIYGLVGLAIAGGVVTVTEVTSKVVPVFPRNGQLVISLVFSPTIDSSQVALSSAGALTSYSSVSAYNHPEDFSFNVTTESIQVYRTGTFDVSRGWTIVPGASHTVTLHSGTKLRFAAVTLPEGNVNVLIKLARASL
ncbi:MAG TPA: hypothetical protein VE177_01475, partial [Candidatus Binatus sp.]|nr:hypothetical protein [Candidatus Binatus sp.]